MSTGGAREVSISNDGVLLEVYEVQDNALQECMMLVQKLSETSLGANEREKSNLTELLAEAQKEVTHLKASLGTANSCVDDLTTGLQQEKEEKLKIQALFESATSELKEKQETVCLLEKENCEQRGSLGEVREQVTALEVDRQVLQKEVEGLRGQNEDADEQICNLNTRLQKERQKTLVSMEESEEQIISLKVLLHDQRQKLEDLRCCSTAELDQLREKLRCQQRVNESLSVEADESIANVTRELDKSRQVNQELSKAKSAATLSVQTLQEEITEMGCELDGWKSRCESITVEKERIVRELTCQLSQKDSECRALTAAREEAEEKQKVVQAEEEELECRLKELQQRIDELLACTTIKDPGTSQEEEQSLKNNPCLGKDNEPAEDAKESDNNRPVNETDWEELYNQLQMENSNLQKQYIKLKKHRNQILRENTNQRHQMQMAIAQLTSNNSRFHRQMEQLRTQLGMAEVFCQEKAQEAHTLELQLQQMLFQNQQFERNHWAAMPPVQRYWQPTRYSNTE